MNKHEIVKTSCLIFGFYFIILTIGNARDVITYFSASTFYDGGIKDLLYGIFITSVQLIINTIIGIYLITHAESITSKITQNKTDELSINLLKVDFIEIALIIIAVSAIVTAIPEILYKIVNYIYFNEFESYEKDKFWSGQQKAAIFYAIFKLAVGLILIFNARNFSKKINRISVKDDEHEKEINTLEQ